MDVAAPRPRVAAPEDETFPNGTFLATALALLAVRGAPVRRTDPPPRHAPRPAAPPPPAAAARRRRRRAAAHEHCDACGGAITWPAHVQPRRASRCHACYREQARAVYRLGLPAMERRADVAAVRAMTAAHAAGRADTEASSVALWAAVEAALEAALEARRALRVAQRRRRRGASAAGPPRARVAPV